MVFHREGGGKSGGLAVDAETAHVKGLTARRRGAAYFRAGGKGRGWGGVALVAQGAVLFYEGLGGVFGHCLKMLLRSSGLCWICRLEHHNYVVPLIFLVRGHSLSLIVFLYMYGKKMSAVP